MKAITILAAIAAAALVSGCETIEKRWEARVAPTAEQQEMRDEIRREKWRQFHLNRGRGIPTPHPL